MARAKNGKVADEIREYGLKRYPGSHLKSPWPGHLDLAVKDKTFAYLSTPGEPFSISCKLPHSASAALILPNAQPTPYGLGKSGWVSVKFEPDEMPDVEMVKAWIEESYRAQAPKKLVAQLDAGGATPAPVKKPAAKKPAAKKPAAKKPAAKKPAAKKPAAKRAPARRK
jgi:predicted DNA-binding protein (MmcQ/YjbR family)